MNRFLDAQQAKEFLVSKISEEAQRRHVALSEVERKMLYFSETGWTLPDMAEVSDEFDSKYDQDQYEKKIASLIASAMKRSRQENREEYDSWSDAIRLLKKEDHYILVMVGLASSQRPGDGPDLRPPHDRLKLWIAGLAGAIIFLCGTFAVMYVSDFVNDKYKIDLSKYIPSRNTFWGYVWVAGASIALIVWILGKIFGQDKVDILGKLFDRFEKTSKPQR